MAVTETQSKMICPSCKVEMNHHCDKLVYNPDPQEAGRPTQVWEEPSQNFHTCPKCGGGASRQA